MTVRITCRTQFDITATGVRGNFNSNRMPFTDAAGQKISNASLWHRSRNQQRNWETFTQLIALRALPAEISEPVMITHDQEPTWVFSFEIDDVNQVSDPVKPLGLLEQDCQGVPMITGLGERAGVQSMIDLGANTQFAFETP